MPVDQDQFCRGCGRPFRDEARDRIVAGLIEALQEAGDASVVISSPRLANLCGLSWSGNHGAAEALRRLVGSES